MKNLVVLTVLTLFFGIILMVENLLSFEFNKFILMLLGGVIYHSSVVNYEEEMVRRYLAKQNKK